MKLLKLFYILLFVTIFSCSSDEDNEPKLSLNGTMFKIKKIETTSANCYFEGNLLDNPQLLYRVKNSTKPYQVKNIEDSYFELTNLERATEYEAKIQISNKSSKLDSKPYYFTTKAVNFDYDEFFKRRGFYTEFSYTGREHKIIGKGLSDFVNDTKVFLISETKTDSLEISSKIISDSLFFTVPENYLSQTPRESVKKVYVGIKIKETYQSILNESGWMNVINGYVNNNDEYYLKLRVINSKPYIREVELTESKKCKKYTKLRFYGEFLSFDDYWAPEKGTFVIFNAKDNSLIDSYTYYYDHSKPSKECSYVKFFQTANNDVNIRRYHTVKVADSHIYLEKGDYTAKFIFTYNNPKKVVESNTIKFTKK